MWLRKRHTGLERSLPFSVCGVLWFMGSMLCFSNGTDTLSKGNSFLGRDDTLVSKDNTFTMGFFSKTVGTTDSLYLGIWYNNFAETTIVWVANRDSPLRNTSRPRLEISGDGNLVLFDEGAMVWSTSMSSTYPAPVEAVLLDGGNLVVRDVSRSSIILWQSFDHPTDTWLPGAKLGFHETNGNVQRLTSWKSPDDPSTGEYSTGVSPYDTSGYFMEWNMSVRYWTSGPWNGKTKIFGSVPELSYSYNFELISNENETYYTYTTMKPDILSMLRIMASGKLVQLVSSKSINNWTEVFAQPRTVTDIFAYCGEFGIFNETSSCCSCLQGFSQLSTEQNRSKDWFGGCERKTLLQCTTGEGKKDRFLKIQKVKLPANSKAYLSQTDRQCKSACEQNCDCKAYAFNSSGCFAWEVDLYDARQLQDDDNSKQDLHLKVSNSDIPNTPGKHKLLEVLVAVLVPLAVIVSGGFIGCFYTSKMKRKGNKSSGQDLLSFDFNYGGNRTNSEANPPGGRIDEYNLPMFSYASVSKATDDFSSEAKLGEGGFGPVYKGKLSNGQEIAVKRLSQRSAQGIEEFRNEIVLIAKLQHRNLVRLLGCSVDQDESILIYEYLPNKSLDFFLFDWKKQKVLEWATRVQIIEGIAQGLVYLHEYSRLHIVHRDLKASNILLDSDMNPKISDFGMARMFDGNNSQTNTRRIVGTLGYMAPEYAMEGFFSIKSDVFSFGVLILEILSGKKNTGFYQKDSLNLLGHTWELWTSNRGMELMDPALGSPQPAMRRYINLGLLCVQENPNDRPAMSIIVSMLNNEHTHFPAPKQPAFAFSRSSMNTSSSSNNAGNYSVNGLTLSTIKPR